MTIGTITVNKKQAALGPVRFDKISFTAETSYPTGGTAAFQAAVRAALAAGDVDIITIVPDDCGGYTPVYDEANDKLKVYYRDLNNAADGPDIEVPNTTNLAGVTFNLTVISR